MLLCHTTLTLAQNKGILEYLKTLMAQVFAHNPTGRKPEWKEDYYQVASIDPGAKQHTGLWIERRYLTGAIVTLLITLADFSSAVDSGGSFVMYLINSLDQYLPLFMECHMILIEHQQIGKNSKVLLVGQHLLTYFCMRLQHSKRNPIIYEVSSRVKSQQFGLKGKRTEIKKQTRLIMKALLRGRKDEASLQTVCKAARCQDLLDAKSMIEAFFILQRLPTALTNEQITWLLKALE